MRLYVCQYRVEFNLISFFPCIEFDQSALKYLYEIAYYWVIGLLLLSCGKPRINGHWVLFNIIVAIKIYHHFPFASITCFITFFFLNAFSSSILPANPSVGITSKSTRDGLSGVRCKVFQPENWLMICFLKLKLRYASCLAFNFAA